MTPKILLAIPVYHAVSPTAFFSHLGLQRAIERASIEGRYKVKTMVMGPRWPIRKARNEAVKMAFKEEATHLAMVDDDMAFEDNWLDILVAADKDIVGALAFTSENNPCSFIPDGNGGEVFDPNPPKFGVHERTAVGTGAILINMDVFKALPEPWFYFDKTTRTMDVNFCRDARAAGFKVWVSSDISLRQKDHREYFSADAKAHVSSKAFEEDPELVAVSAVG